MVNWFKPKQHPHKGYAYAVTAGVYVGEMFVYVEEKDDNYHFISIPSNINRQVPKEKFEFGLVNKIVDPVTKIDSKVLKLLNKQYEYNIKHK